MGPFIARAVLWLVFGFFVTDIAMWIFVICLLVGIPIVWWGVIKKTITGTSSLNWQVPLPR